MSKRPSGRIRTGHIYKQTKTKTIDEKKTNMETIDYDKLECKKCGFKPSWNDSAFVPLDVINRYLYNDYLKHLENCH